MNRSTLKASANHILAADKNLSDCELAFKELTDISEKRGNTRRITVEGNGNKQYLQDCLTMDEMVEVAKAMEPVLQKIVESRRRDLESYMIGKEV